MSLSENHRQGEWVVHSKYGIGQIKKTVNKSISGEDKHYYKVVAANSTYWIPVEQIDSIESSDMRPISSAAEMKEAIAQLTTSPVEMSSDYKVRQKRIKQALATNTPLAVSGIVRDLWAHWRHKKGSINTRERESFQALKKRLAEEWSIVAGTTADEAASNIEKILNPQLAALSSG